MGEWTCPHCGADGDRITQWAGGVTVHCGECGWGRAYQELQPEEVLPVLCCPWCNGTLVLVEASDRWVSYLCAVCRGWVALGVEVRLEGPSFRPGMEECLLNEVKKALSGLGGSA